VFYINPVDTIIIIRFNVVGVINVNNVVTKPYCKVGQS